MFIIKSINLALSFLLELCLLAAFGYWGFRTGQGLGLQILLGIGIPVVVGVVWGIFLAPTSARRLQGLALIGLKIVLFGAAAGALYLVEQTGLAFIFAVIFAINMILALAWGQERLSRQIAQGQK